MEFTKEDLLDIHKRIKDVASSALQSQAAEIQQLKEQLAAEKEARERTERERDQAIDSGSFRLVKITEENQREFYNGHRHIGQTVIAGVASTEQFIAGHQDSEPDLYAHLDRLAGRES